MPHDFFLCGFGVFSAILYKSFGAVSVAVRLCCLASSFLAVLDSLIVIVLVSPAAMLTLAEPITIVFFFAFLPLPVLTVVVICTLPVQVALLSPVQPSLTGALPPVTTEVVVSSVKIADFGGGGGGVVVNVWSAPLLVSLNVAVMVVSAVRLTLHVPVPEHPAPDQPANEECAAGVAVRITCPSSSSALHVAPQVIPAGELLIEPEPLPAFEMVRVCCGVGMKVAVIVAAAFRVIWQGSVPEHPPPDQPLNVMPVSGVAVSVIVVPSSYTSVHVPPPLEQLLIAPVSALTEPEPAPAGVTVSRCCSTAW